MSGSILDELESSGFVVVPVKGVSMRPLLYADSSQVLIRKPAGRPGKNDVVLYVRPDGRLILHRIIGFDGDVCLIRGDNTFSTERVPLSSVKGVMDTIWRGGHEIHTSDFQYHFYVWLWTRSYPFRLLWHKGKKGLMDTGKLLVGDTPLGWIIRRAKDSLAGIGLLTLCTGVVAFLSVILALVMRNAVDAAVALHSDRFLRWILVFLGIILAQLAIRAVIRQLDESIRASLENSLKEHTYEAILRSSYRALKTSHTGELQNRMTNDVKIVADYATDLLPGIFSMLVQLLCAMAVLLFLDWRFGSLFLIGGGVLMGVTFLFRRRMKNLHKKVQETDGELRSWLQESVESIQILKSFEAEEMAAARTAKKAAAHRKARMERRTFSNLCNIGFGAVMQGSYLFGLVWCGFGILKGTLTYGTLTAVLELIGQIRSPFANISGLVPQYYSMLASAERLMELENLPKESGPPENLPAFEGLHTEKMSFQYDDGEETVIREATFDIEKGEIVALTGISGIGKSTLLKLLTGIYAPVSGRLYANDGIDISPSTRGWFSYVPQGNMLMSGDIYGAVDFLHCAPYTDEQKERVEQACKIACADAFIRNLPDGYSTVLGEKGTGLSEGQMQRIAIARAIYRDAPVLLLDEATSALDEQTEHEILKNLKALEDKTVLIVTHRPAAMEICSKRLVFENTDIVTEPLRSRETGKARDKTGADQSP
ncbi:MAG: ATP-binding cassette domain-containing protein [Lachnospiraceae bacterium]|nr:ATP-binding cassette domain-containing protein [Lachnospiraceae bacterium]